MSRSPKKHYLSNEERLYIVFERDQNTSYETIKSRFKKKYKRTIYDSTISYISKKKRETGSVEDREKSGRRRVYDSREERQIVRAAVTNNKESLRDLAKNDIINDKGVSWITIRNIVMSYGVYSRIKPKRLDDLSQKNIKNRLKFAQDHLHWTKSEWDLVIFSDEADLFPTKTGREYVRLRPNQLLVDALPASKQSRKNVTVKVWGAICSSGVGPLVRYTGTIRKENYLKMLQTYLFHAYPMLERPPPEAECGFPPFIFMDDNAPAHTAKIVKAWKRENGIVTLTWPSKSPDLNIIENIWAYVQDELYRIRDHITCPDDTWREALNIWNNIPIAYIENLYNSLPNRMNEIKLKKGGPIDY